MPVLLPAQMYAMYDVMIHSSSVTCIKSHGGETGMPVLLPAQMYAMYAMYDAMNHSDSVTCITWW